MKDWILLMVRVRLSRCLLFTVVGYYLEGYTTSNWQVFFTFSFPWGKNMAKNTIHHFERQQFFYQPRQMTDSHWRRLCENSKSCKRHNPMWQLLSRKLQQSEHRCTLQKHTGQIIMYIAAKLVLLLCVHFHCSSGVNNIGVFEVSSYSRSYW